MRIARFTASAVVAASLFVAAGAASAAQVYKWKDANGVTHFTDAPPPKGTAVDRVNVRSAPLSGSSAPAPATPDPAAATTPGAPGAAPPTTAEAQAAVATLRRQACENARARAQQLANLPSVSMDLDQDGTPEQLNAEQHAAQLDQANRAVVNYCGGQ